MSLKEEIIEHLPSLKKFANRFSNKLRIHAASLWREPEDLVNDTILAALATNSYDPEKLGPGGLSAWLYRLMQNEFIRAYHKDKKSYIILSKGIEQEKGKDAFLIYRETEVKKLESRQQIMKVVHAIPSIKSPSSRQAIQFFLEGRRGMVGYHTHLYNARKELRAIMGMG